MWFSQSNQIAVIWSVQMHLFLLHDFRERSSSFSLEIKVSLSSLWGLLSSPVSSPRDPILSSSLPFSSLPFSVPFPPKNLSFGLPLPLVRLSLPSCHSPALLHPFPSPIYTHYLSPPSMRRSTVFLGSSALCMCPPATLWPSRIIAWISRTGLCSATAFPPLPPLL